MTGGKRKECAKGVKIIPTVAALLPADILPGLETLINLLLCGPKVEEMEPEETCVGLKEGDNCGYGATGDCCDGLACLPKPCSGKVCEVQNICQEAPQCSVLGRNVPCIVLGGSMYHK